MSMEKRTFTKEKKLEILKEATAHGVTATLEKHGIYPATYYSCCLLYTSPSPRDRG